MAVGLHYRSTWKRGNGNRMMDNLPRKTVVTFVGFVFLYSLLFLFFDRLIDQWVHTHFDHTWVKTLGTFVSHLAYGPAVEIGLTLGFIVGIMGIISNDRKNQYWASCLFYVCMSCAAAIVIGEGLKIILARYRPVMLFESGEYGLHFFSTKWGLNSTPSGHTIRAFAIMTALSLLFPRGRILFLAIAVLIGLSRVAVTAHYPSDVLFGAFIGIFSALWTYKLRNA
jgi:membrane-associated phospholipid phosphatase